MAYPQSYVPVAYPMHVYAMVPMGPSGMPPSVPPLPPPSSPFVMMPNHFSAPPFQYASWDALRSWAAVQPTPMHVLADAPQPPPPPPPQQTSPQLPTIHMTLGGLQFTDEDLRDTPDLEDLRMHTEISVVTDPVASDMCSVCADSYQPYSVVRTLPCRHRFHMECIDRVFENDDRCPMCRHSVMASPPPQHSNGPTLPEEDEDDDESVPSPIVRPRRALPHAPLTPSTVRGNTLSRANPAQ